MGQRDAKCGKGLWEKTKEGSLSKKLLEVKWCHQHI